MIEGQDIICFCNDWDGDPLSKKQIVTRLAKRNRILWVNSTGNRNPTASARDLRRAWNKVRQFSRGCRQVDYNISVFSPLVIPFHGNPTARRLNRHIFSFTLRNTCRKLGFRDPITLTFVPSSADVVGSLGERLVLYYCVDEYSQFSGTNTAAILEMERRLIARSDFVVVSASRLLETKRLHNPHTVMITHGVDVSHFRRACNADTPIPVDLPKMSGPVIGFFGLIEDWVDVALIRELAVARPAWSVVMIGEVRADVAALKACPNVHLLGRKPYASLPGYCKAFDVAILPFVRNELTLAANPLKLREYLAAGLPVVASPLPEVQKLADQVFLASTAEEYLERIDALLSAGVRGPSLSASLRMDSESWDHKVEELSRYIAQYQRNGLPDTAYAAAGRVR